MAIIYHQPKTGIILHGDHPQKLVIAQMLACEIARDKKRSTKSYMVIDAKEALKTFPQHTLQRPKTKTIIINDCPGDYDYEHFYNAITEGVFAFKRPDIMLRVKIHPIFIFITERITCAQGASFERRLKPVVANLDLQIVADLPF